MFRGAFLVRAVFVCALLATVVVAETPRDHHHCLPNTHPREDLSFCGGVARGHGKGIDEGNVGVEWLVTPQHELDAKARAEYEHVLSSEAFMGHSRSCALAVQTFVCLKYFRPCTREGHEDTQYSICHSDCLSLEASCGIDASKDAPFLHSSDCVADTDDRAVCPMAHRYERSSLPKDRKIELTQPLKTLQTPELSFTWFGWGLCDALATIGKSYPKATITKNCPAISQWYSTTFDGFSNQGGDDILLLDSQWVGEAVTGGHVHDITKPLTDTLRLKDYYSVALQAYGEYPPNSEKYYGIAFLGDVQMILYRKDLFAKYGRSPPDTLTDLLDTAKFFKNQVSEISEGFSSMWCGDPNSCYDELATIWNQFAWMHGGELWDDKTYMIEGVLNSAANEEALNYMTELFGTSSGNPNATFDNTIDDICNNKAAMAMIWLAFGPVFTDATGCPQANNIGYTIIPAHPMTRDHVLSLGGMGMHISKYTKNYDLALDFVLWAQQFDQQVLWTQLGGNSPRKSVAARPSYINSQPYNLVYFQSYPLTRDFWNIPEYSKMLPRHMEGLWNVLRGLQTPMQALNTMAAAQQAIIDEAYPWGPDGPPKKEVPVTLIVILCCVALVAIILVAFVIWSQLEKRKKRALIASYEQTAEEGRAKLKAVELRAEKAEAVTKSFLVKYKELTLGKKIGTGAFGDVHLGDFRQTPVAIKKLKNSSLSTDVMKEFESEVQVLGSLRHPNCVLFMGACVEKPNLCIITEFMSNGALYDILHNEDIHLDLSLMISFARDAAKGMNYLHNAAQPIVHRDLKSLNLLVDDKMVLKVADFGLANVKDEVTAEESSDMAAGSFYWMAPEVIKSGQWTTKADVYSYGITLFEIFSREDPYQGMSPIAVMHGVTHDQLRPKVPDTVPPNVLKLMERCWSENPEVRPSFAAIIEEISRWTVGASKGTEAAARQVPPPLGNIAIVFTDVEGSTTLWDKSPKDMGDALSLHNGIIRHELRECSGYEVKTEGDAFMIAFASVVDAVRFMVKAQIALNEADWPRALYGNSKASQVPHPSENDKMLFSGLRVRMGVHVGKVQARPDPVSRRMDYFGRSVNTAARVSGQARGGQIFLSQEAFNSLQEWAAPEDMKEYHTISQGQVFLKGIKDAVSLFCLYPVSLQDRSMPGLIIAQDSSGPAVGASTRFDLRSSSTNKTSRSNLSLTDVLSAEDMPFLAFGEKSPWQVSHTELEVGDLIASGSYGDVFHCTWRGSKVAYKRLKNQKMNDRTRVDFMTEVSMLSNLRHPNIVLFMGACVEPGHFGILYEYVQHGSLYDVIYDKTVDLDDEKRINLAVQTARALAFLHSHDPPIVHRDVKSQNVLITSQMQARVCDFGFATVKSSSNLMTSVGTAGWMAPEQLKGGAYSEKADVFALGMVMYELFTGKSPMGSHAPMVAMSKVIKGERPDLPPTVPEPVQALIKQAWAQDPHSRPSVQNIHDELLKLQS